MVRFVMIKDYIEITNIMIFGVLGTLVTYIFFAGLTYWIHSYGWMKMYDSDTE